MLYRITIALLIVSFASCSIQQSDETIIEENYTFWDPNLNDSIKALQVGNQFVDEKNVISFQAIKHELVDKTPALVKLKARIIEINGNNCSLIVDRDTLKGGFQFKIDQPKAFINQKIIAQGKIQMHPEVTFEVDAILVLDMQKKSP